MQLSSIQYLRAVAVSWIVLFHINNQLSYLNYNYRFGEWLAAGVDIFFVISGFVMVSSTHGRQIQPLTFYRNRIVRIVPLYWLILTVAVIMGEIKPFLFNNDPIDYYWIVTSYLFFPSLSPISGQIWPVLVPGWTLNYEMFFYLIFGFWLLVPKEIRYWQVAFTFFFFIFLGSLINNVPMQFYSDSIIVEFLLGIVIGVIYKKGIKSSTVFSTLMIVLGFMLIAFSGFTETSSIRALVWGGPAALIVHGFVSLERQIKIPMVSTPLLVGDASYSIYLVHTLFLYVFAKLWDHFHAFPTPLMNNEYVFIALAVTGSIIIGVITYILVEKNLIKLFK